MEKFKKIILPKIEYVMPAVSVILTAFDMASDLALALEYKNTGDDLFYILTLTFLLVPGSVLGLLLLFFFCVTLYEAIKVSIKSATGCCKTFSVTFFAIVTSWHDWEYWPRWKYFACMTESGPQLILQLYILTAPESRYFAMHTPVHSDNYNSTAKVLDYTNMSTLNRSTVAIPKQENGESEEGVVSFALQIISILSSLMSISWGAVKMKKSEDEGEGLFVVTTLDIVLDMVWNLLCMSSRVIVLALFASRFILEFWVLISFHFAVISSIFFEKTYKKDNTCIRCEKLCEGCFQSLLYGIGCSFFNMIQVTVRRHNLRSYRVYVLYWLIMTLENTILIVVWYWKVETEGLWYDVPAIVYVVTAYTTSFFVKTWHVCYRNHNRVTPVTEKDRSIPGLLATYWSFFKKYDN